MRMLVTGGAGFIGSNLVRALAGDGHDVVVADNLVGPRSLRLLEDVLPRVTFAHADLRVPHDLDRLPPGRWDRIYHLAASFANALSVAHPELDEATNVGGTSNVLAYARRSGCGLFVYTGSSSSYGAVGVPFREDGPMAPQTPYALSKRRGEDLVARSGLQAAIFRLFNVFGPGDWPGYFRNVVPNMFAAASRPDGRILVTGGDATRDFTYVDDVVRVLLEPERASGSVVNVGTGVETKVVDLAREVLLLLDLPERRLTIGDARPWDQVVRRCADLTRARTLYELRSTPLTVGLERTCRWLHDGGWLRAS